jgi:hypothetical protein
MHVGVHFPFATTPPLLLPSAALPVPDSFRSTHYEREKLGLLAGWVTKRCDDLEVALLVLSRIATLQQGKNHIGRDVRVFLRCFFEASQCCGAVAPMSLGQVRCREQRDS